MHVLAGWLGSLEYLCNSLPKSSPRVRFGIEWGTALAAKRFLSVVLFYRADT